MAEERLQKVLASAGIASRRASEELIVAGRVTVNGERVTELGTKVDPAEAEIKVDGKLVSLPPRHVYIKLHKPRGVISDIGGNADGRQTVADLLPPKMGRLFPVGRLDLNSEGLVLLTDDGALAHKLTHPRFEHPKTYYVLLQDRPSFAALDQLRKGVELADGKTAPAEVRVVSELPAALKLAPGPIMGTWLEIVLREGKKRQIRHMTAAVGHPTLRLLRWAIGPLVLGDLAVGQMINLTRHEVASLESASNTRRSPAVKAGPRGEVARPSAREDRPRTSRAAAGSYAAGRSTSGRPSRDRPAGGRPSAGGRPAGGRPAGTKTAGGNAPKRNPRANARPSSRPGARPGARPGSGSTGR